METPEESFEGKPEFFFGNNEVGLLMRTGPWEPGLWRYHPYRGPGHYDMVTCISSGGVAVCNVDDRDFRFKFVVVGLASSGDYALAVSSVEFEPER